MSSFSFKITCPYCGRINNVHVSYEGLFEKQVVACRVIGKHGFDDGCRKDFVVAFDVDIRPRAFMMVEAPLHEAMK